MMTTAELRLGNLLTWDPAIAHPASTLSSLIVEVASILPAQVGYVPANIGRRVEPFEDDLIQQEPVLRDVQEFRPVLLTGEMIQVLQNENFPIDISTLLTTQIIFLHQYQNLFFLLTGKEADMNVLHHLLTT
jgi:hypothetical protein